MRPFSLRTILLFWAVLAVLATLCGLGLTECTMWVAGVPIDEYRMIRAMQATLRPPPDTTETSW